MAIETSRERARVGVAQFAKHFSEIVSILERADVVSLGAVFTVREIESFPRVRIVGHRRGDARRGATRAMEREAAR